MRDTPYATWSEAKGLASDDGAVFTGRIGARRTALEAGGEGATLEIAVSGLAEDPLLVTASNAGDHPMGALFDHALLARELTSVGITASRVRLRFVPGASTESLDAALRAIDEVLYAPPAR